MRSLMTSVEHKYFEHPDFIIRHLEWYAFHHILFDGNWTKIGDAILAYYQKHSIGKTTLTLKQKINIIRLNVRYSKKK